MWGLAFQYGFTSGVILEPSCGTGRFLRYVDPTADYKHLIAKQKLFNLFNIKA